ncbi:hypothetical protein D3C85_1617030 [compost metagenome]
MRQSGIRAGENHRIEGGAGSAHFFHQIIQLGNQLDFADSGFDMRETLAEHFLHQLSGMFHPADFLGGFLRAHGPQQMADIPEGIRRNRFGQLFITAYGEMLLLDAHSSRLRACKT